VHIVDKVSFGLVYIVDKVSFGLYLMHQQPFYTTIIVFIGVLIYGTATRQIDFNRIATEIFNAIREDISTSLNEIWLSFQNAFITLYRTITIVKLMEIIIIGLLLSSLPDVLNFFVKTLFKVAKIPS
jgi:hypothetical protein